MNRIDKKFKDLRQNNQKAFIAYICAGDPNADFTEKLVLELDRIGVDIVELGIPFSDPIADGPTIQRSSERALKNNFTIYKAIDIVRRIRKRSEIPIVFMGYYNPIFRYGLNNFFKNSSASGLDGLIIADVPFEESGDISKLASRYGIDNISLVAPTTGEDRLRGILKEARGFIYYISLTGITGARKSLSLGLIQKIKVMKSITEKPVCVGFGISEPIQIKKIRNFCDGVIIGSAIINVIEKNLKNKDLLKKISCFTRRLIVALKEG